MSGSNIIRFKKGEEIWIDVEEEIKHNYPHVYSKEYKEIFIETLLMKPFKMIYKEAIALYNTKISSFKDDNYCGVGSPFMDAYESIKENQINNMILTKKKIKIKHDMDIGLFDLSKGDILEVIKAPRFEEEKDGCVWVKGEKDIFLLDEDELEYI